MKTSQGFTLIELLVTLTVLAVLLTVAVGSYRSFVVTQRVKGASYDLMTALIFARSEATKRNASVSVVRSAAGWSGGWTVAAGTAVLRTQNPYQNGVAITDSAGLSTLTYANDGRLSSATTNFTIAPSGTSSTATPRCISIKLGGMPVARSGSC